jgi:hypothetical protein
MKSRRKPARKTHATHREHPILWETFARELTDTVEQTEEQAANLAVESGRTATAVMRYLFHPFFGPPTGAKTGRTSAAIEKAA